MEDNTIPMWVFWLVFFGSLAGLIWFTLHLKRLGKEIKDKELVLRIFKQNDDDDIDKMGFV